jgi:hypothetical protein
MSGTITVSAEIAAGGTTTLTLVADGSVILNAPITRTSTGESRSPRRAAGSVDRETSTFQVET